MSDQDHAIRDDIAFMRALAEEGRAGPLTGGPILVAAGLIFGATSLVTYGLIVRGLTGSGIVFPVIWFGAAGVFMLTLFWLKRGAPARGGAARAAAVAWSGAGWAIFTIVVSLMVLSARLGNWTLMAALPAMILAIYGSAWFVGALLSRLRWVWAVCAGSFAMAVVIAWYATEPATLYLIYAACLLGLLALPGLIMMRQARRAA